MRVMPGEGGLLRGPSPREGRCPGRTRESPQPAAALAWAVAQTRATRLVWRTSSHDPCDPRAPSEVVSSLTHRPVHAQVSRGTRLQLGPLRAQRSACRGPRTGKAQTREEGESGTTQRERPDPRVTRNRLYTVKCPLPPPKKKDRNCERKSDALEKGQSKHTAGISGASKTKKCRRKS